jgi:hypothetical protein
MPLEGPGNLFAIIIYAGYKIQDSQAVPQSESELIMLLKIRGTVLKEKGTVLEKEARKGPSR